MNPQSWTLVELQPVLRQPLQNLKDRSKPNLNKKSKRNLPRSRSMTRKLV